MADFSGMKLTGYSSDELEIERIFNNVPSKMRFGKLIKSKADRLQEKRERLFTKEQPSDSDEWFCYLVDGEKWYYKVAQDLNILRMHHNAEFLGIGKPNQKFSKVDPPAVDRKLGQCCYCEVWLTQRIGSPIDTDKTREHVVPRSKGGKGKPTLPCCYRCNMEKADLSLREYIICLNILFVNTPKDSPDHELIKRKIKNANEIAKSFNN